MLDPRGQTPDREIAAQPCVESADHYFVDAELLRITISLAHRQDLMDPQFQAPPDGGLFKTEAEANRSGEQGSINVRVCCIIRSMISLIILG